MSNSASKKLTLVKEIMREGKIEDALQIVKDIEQMENLTHKETLRTLFHKADLYYNSGQYKNALKFTEELYQKSQEKKMPLFSLDALVIKAWILYNLQEFEESYKSFQQHENLFKSIPRENSPEFQEREAELLLQKGYQNYVSGNFDLALDYCNKSLILQEQGHTHSSSSFSPSELLPFIYLAKGELKLALEYAEKALSSNPKGEYYLVNKANIYRVIGVIYQEKGDLNNALEDQKRALDIYMKVGGSMWMAWSYLHIIQVLLTKKEFTLAQNYLKEFKQYSKENVEDWLSNNLYPLATALVLKSSSRMRDRVEAETILKKIVEESSFIFLTNFALMNLCDWYFEEFRISNQMDILDDIHPLIDHLQRNARETNSFLFLANTKLFQAKLALLQINLLEARKLLTEAQLIADEHDLQLLAGAISKEHDLLLDELKQWESFKKTQTPVSERIKLASIDDVMKRLQGRRAIEVPEANIEEPILLLIMDKSGVTYFNHSFIGDWDFDDLFSSFMSAFNSFSGEIFSKSIDRIKIGENTILINPIEPFLACYIIKGQSYPAQQKLTRFSDAIKATTEIWEALNRAVKTSEMLELNNPPSLGSAVNEIFIS